MKEIQLGQTTYFYFPVNNTAGSGTDAASTAFAVRKCGSAADAAPVFSGTASLLSSNSYPAGCYEIAIPVTEGNGFEVNSEYAVFATVAVDSQNPTGLAGSFSIPPSVGSVTAHFTNQTANGASSVETVSGNYTAHVTGTFDGANVVMRAGTVGQDPAEFNTIRTFTGPQTRNFKLAGDVQFQVNNAGVGTSISVSLQEIP